MVLVSASDEYHQNASGREHGRKFLRYLQKKKEASNRNGKDLATSSYSTYKTDDSSKKSNDCEIKPHSASHNLNDSQSIGEQRRAYMAELAERKRNSTPSAQTVKVTTSDLSDQDSEVHPVLPQYPRREITGSQRKSYMTELAKTKRSQKEEESRGDINTMLTETEKRDNSILRDEPEHRKGRKTRRDSLNSRTKLQSRADYFDQLYKYKALKEAETRRGQPGSAISENTEIDSVHSRYHPKETEHDVTFSSDIEDAEAKDSTSRKALKAKKKNKQVSRSHSSGLPRSSKSKSFREDRSSSRKRATGDSRSGRSSRPLIVDHKSTSLWDKSLLQMLGESLFGDMEQAPSKVASEDLPFSVVHLDDEEECSAVTLDDKLEN